MYYNIHYFTRPFSTKFFQNKNSKLADPWLEKKEEY